jgi:hypothetical protein
LQALKTLAGWLQLVVLGSPGSLFIQENEEHFPQAERPKIPAEFQITKKKRRKRIKKAESN